MATPASLRRWTTVHRWSSLFCTANLLFLCVTGLLLIFHPEIDAMLGSMPEIRQEGRTMLPPGQLVEAAREARPGWSPAVYSEDEDHPGRAYVSMLPPGVQDLGESKTVILDGFTGQAAEVKLDQTFSMIVLNLHANLFAGFIGELFLALVGIAFFVALISGVVLYAPFMRSCLYGLIRRDRSRRIFQLDLHNLVGISTLAWCCVVCFTGIILELGKPLLMIYQHQDLAAMTAPFKDRPAPERIVPLDQAIATAQQAWPAHRMQFAVFPGTQLTGQHHFTLFMAAESGLAKRVPKLTLVDAATGELTVASDAPWYIQALFVSGPLHFGDYAGTPLRIIWALFTILTIILCVSGLYLFIAKLRGRRRDLPLLQEATS
ncbi:putative iron-regulated membrane protein [Prosthecobacter fusiformis]|uniref:Putative iron-regulated membrane protein n=1 Tax=Prosthecobacter fusiformis TaxID=48464 RepID=A0A4R7SSG1_9BACT|nr:PepSY-associated TM helix domain-containing protein [Prosthecobacter fusiformis]TDU81416.1 putative iron-regulated membrane protein [Prosthecobacter fusiformis]